MVRHKTRWLLVRLDFEHNVQWGGEPKARRQDDDGGGTGLTKKDLAKCIRDSIASSFGIAASGMAQDIQGASNCGGDHISTIGRLTSPSSYVPTMYVTNHAHTTRRLRFVVRLYDESSRLAMIRVARDSCDMVRAAICFTTVYSRQISGGFGSLCKWKCKNGQESSLARNATKFPKKESFNG